MNMKVILAKQYIEDDIFTDDLIKEFNDRGIDIELVSKYTKSSLLKFINNNSNYDVLILQEYLEAQFPVKDDYLNLIQEECPNLNIIFIISQEHKNDILYLQSIYNTKVYNILFDNDADIKNIVSLILNPRHPKLTKSYLNITHNDDITNGNIKPSKVVQEQIDGITEFLYSASDINDLLKKYDELILRYSDAENVYVLSKLPSDITEKLSKNLNFSKYKILLEKIEDADFQINPSKKEKIKVEEKVIVKTIEKTVEKTVVAKLDKKLILVGDLSSRAGSTFVALNLAKALTQYDVMPAIIEPPLELPFIFDNVGMELRLNKTCEEESLDFYSYPHEIFNNNEVQKDKETIDDNIIWIVPDPRRPVIDEREWDYHKTMKLIYSSRKANVSILDVGTKILHESIYPILTSNEIDLILVIVDPMPTEIMQNNKVLQKLLEVKDKGGPVEFVINKWTDGVNKKELMEFLDVNPFTLIPAIDLKYIHEATYNCKVAYDLSDVKNIFDDAFKPVIEKIVPKELIMKKRNVKKNNLFKKLISRKFRKGVCN